MEKIQKSPSRPPSLDLLYPEETDSKRVSIGLEDSHPLGMGYQLNKYDVLSGRGKSSLNYAGNRRFRLYVARYVDEYMQTRARAAKRACIAHILETVRSAGGHFLRQDRDKMWHDIGDKAAKDKIGHILRDSQNDIVQQVPATMSGLWPAASKANQNSSQINSHLFERIRSLDTSAGIGISVAPDNVTMNNTLAIDSRNMRDMLRLERIHHRSSSTLEEDMSSKDRWGHLFRDIDGSVPPAIGLHDSSLVDARIAQLLAEEPGTSPVTLKPATSAEAETGIPNFDMLAEADIIPYRFDKIRHNAGTPAAAFTVPYSRIDHSMIGNPTAIAHHPTITTGASRVRDEANRHVASRVLSLCNDQDDTVADDEEDSKPAARNC